MLNSAGAPCLCFYFARPAGLNFSRVARDPPPRMAYGTPVLLKQPHDISERMCSTINCIGSENQSARMTPSFLNSNLKRNMLRVSSKHITLTIHSFIYPSILPSIKMDSTALIAHVPESVFPVVSGCVAFGTTLALSTLAQKMVGISTGTKIVPTVAGMATVALASLASQQMAVYNHQYMQSEYYNPSKRSPFHPQRRQPLLVATSASGRRDYLEVASFKIPLHELRV